MKVILRNSSLIFQKKNTLYTSGVVPNSYVESLPDIKSLSGYTGWWFKNATNEAQTWKIVGPVNVFSGQYFAFRTEAQPAVGVNVVAYLGDEHEAGSSSATSTFTLQAGQYFYTCGYNFSDSSAQRTPTSITCNGESVELPTN